MRQLLWPALVIMWKDLLMELRTRQVVTSVAVFAVLVVVIFQFALSPRPDLARTLAPGLLWVAFSFAGVLAMGRAFMVEKETGGLEALFLTPIPRDALYLGKMLSVFVFMLVIEAVLMPVFVVMLRMQGMPVVLFGVVALATLGFASVGTLFSAMAVNTRSRETMLPLLFFPVVVPVIIGAVEAGRAIVGGEAPWRWLALIGAFDIIYLAIAPWVFQYVLEE